MKKTLEMLSTSAAAIFVGFGVMPQTSTPLVTNNIRPPVVVTTPLRVNQTASSVVKMEIMKMRMWIERIGEDNYKRMQEIARLEKGWDGRNARPIPKSVMTRTIDLLAILPGGAKIFPTGRSSVQIEYHQDDDNYLELEVTSTSYEIYSMKGENEFEGSISKKDVENHVNAFFA